MASKKITALTALPSPAGSDLTAVVDMSGTPTTKKSTLAQVTTLIGSLITVAQSQVTGLIAALALKVDTSDARLSDARIPTSHNHTSTANDGGVLTADEHASFSEYTGISAPSAPAASKLRLYASANNGHVRPVYQDPDGTVVRLSRDNVVLVKNTTGSSVVAGQMVYVNGASGNIPTIALADADDVAQIATGMVREATIANNGFGLIIAAGEVPNLNTNAFTEGTIVYLSQTAGAYTDTAPSEPAAKQRIGVVTRQHSSQGTIEVDFGFSSVQPRLHAILDSTVHSDTLTGSVTRGDVIFGNSTPKWARKAVGTGVLVADGTDVTGWSQAPTLTTPSMTTPIISTLLNLTAGQIKFPATQISSADANTLDDYERGSWTPGIAFGGAAIGVTFSAQIGRYIKIGRTVFLFGSWVLTSKGSSTGNAALTGLPFTSNATAASCLFFNRTGNLNVITGITGSIPINGTTVNLADYAGTVANDTHFNNNSFTDGMMGFYEATT